MRTVADYGHPNIYIPSDDFSKICIDYNLEKKWLGFQFMSRIQPEYSVVDQRWIDSAFRKCISGKKKNPNKLEPLLSTCFFLNPAYKGYSNFSKLNLFLFFNSVNQKFLKTQEYSSKKFLVHTMDPTLGSDRLLNLLSELIRIRKHQLYLPGINTSGYVNKIQSTSYDSEVKTEADDFIKELMDFTLSNRDKEVMFGNDKHEGLELNRHEKNYKLDISDLEGMLQKRIDESNLKKTYELAVSTGTIHYEYVTPASEYDIRKEIEFVKDYFNSAFGIDVEKYKKVKQKYCHSNRYKLSHQKKMKEKKPEEPARKQDTSGELNKISTQHVFLTGTTSNKSPRTNFNVNIRNIREKKDIIRFSLSKKFKRAHFDLPNKGSNLDLKTLDSNNSNMKILPSNHQLRQLTHGIINPVTPNKNPSKINLNSSGDTSREIKTFRLKKFNQRQSESPSSVFETEKELFDSSQKFERRRVSKIEILVRGETNAGIGRNTNKFTSNNASSYSPKLNEKVGNYPSEATIKSPKKEIEFTPLQKALKKLSQSPKLRPVWFINGQPN